MGTVFIDGSMGEGGGQILRTSLALACITGRNLHIENIRASRRKPGLAKQHLICVRAACKICGGKCEGAKIGSQVLDFQPGPIRGGDFSFDIGSAGSATLVIQTILPALFLADKPSTVSVTGGTHNPWAPPYDFLAETFLPAIRSAGFDADCKLEKHGFYPAGGGKIVLNISPRQEKPKFVRWASSPAHAVSIQHGQTSCPSYGCQKAENIQIHARIYTAKLPAHIAQRQKNLLLQSRLKFKNIEHIEVTDSDGPGNCIMLRLCGGGRTTLFTAFGQKGKPSEKVVGEVVSLAKDFLHIGAAIDHFLADQLLIYIAINSHFTKDSETGALNNACCYTTNELSTHLTTNIETIKKFLPVEFKTEHKDRIYWISCKLV
jgi:RNA 3'-terminal phosphate cyclase (ATP)